MYKTSFTLNFWKVSFRTQSSESVLPKKNLKKCPNFEMYFWYLQFYQKTNEKIRLNYYGTLSQSVFRSFFERIEDTKSHFEINWPLIEISSQQELNAMAYISHGLCVQKLAEHLLHILGRWCHHSKITLWTQEGLASSYIFL